MKWSVGEVIHSQGNRAGHSFSVAMDGKKKLSQILDSLDEPSLRQLIRDSE
jgi:hypothetical protein